MKEGWICKNGKYGTWFISKQAVIDDWKTANKRAGIVVSEELNESEVLTWFNEQISWVEVAAYGKQVEVADMKAWERVFLSDMKEDTDYLDHVEYVNNQ